jgi:4-coumarate--CoA ligase
MPKGVILTHANMVANSYQARKMDIKTMLYDIDGQLGMLPFFHIYVSHIPSIYLPMLIDQTDG